MKAFLVVAVLALVCTTHANMRGRDLGRIENNKERLARSAEAAAAAAPRDLGAELKALHAESAAAMAETDFEEELNNNDSGSGPVQAPGSDDKRNPPPPPSSPPLKDGVAPQIVDKIEKPQAPEAANSDGWTTVSSNHKAVKPPQAELDELDKHAGSLYDDIIADLDEMDYAVEPPTEKPAEEEPAVEAPVEETSEEIKKEDEESEAEKHEKKADETQVVEVPRPVPMEPAQAYFVALHGGPPKAARPNYKCELCMMVMGRKMAGQNEDLCAGLTHEEDKVICEHVIATMTAYDRYLVDWLYYEGCERYNPKKKEDKKDADKEEDESKKVADEATAAAGEPKEKEKEESPAEEGADAQEVADAKKDEKGTTEPALLQEAEDSNADEAAVGAEEALQDKKAEKEEASEEAAEEGTEDAAKDNDETADEKDSESEWVVTIPCPPHALCSWMTMPGESSPFCDINVTKYRRTKRFYEKHVIPLQNEEKNDEDEVAKGDKAAEDSEPSTQEAKEGEKEEAAEGAKESAAPDETGNHAAPEQPIPDEPTVDAPSTEAEADTGNDSEEGQN